MNHELEQSHINLKSAEFASSGNGVVEPGQFSRSDLLRKPEHAMASGLVQRNARGGSTDAAAATKSDIPSAPEQRFAVATAGPVGEIPFRAEMERGFGADFGDVRAHVGGAQAEIGLRGLGADGATQGSTVVFASSSPSRELVAHELAHVVQNRNGGVAGNAEAAADDAAAAVAYGGRAMVGGGPGAEIQRHGDHSASAVHVSDLIVQAAAAGDEALLGRIANALHTADRSIASDDAATSSTSTPEVTVRIEGEDLCLARADLLPLLHEIEAAGSQLMAPVASPARPQRSAAPSRSGAPTSSLPTPAPMSGQPTPALATGEPAADAMAVQWMIAEAVRSGDSQALAVILNALHFSNASAHDSDAAASASVTDFVPVTVRGTSYNLRRNDVLCLIREAQNGAHTLPGDPLMPLGPLADHVSVNTNLQSASASFTLPSGLELSSSSDYTLRTLGAASVTLTVTSTGMFVAISPAIEIDVLGPGNMHLSEISYDFGTQAVDIMLTGNGWGPWDYRPEARAKITNLVLNMLRGTRAGIAGYDPLHDPDLVDTANAIADNFRNIPTAPSTTSDASLASMQTLATSVTLAARSQIEVPAGDHVVRILAGHPITVQVQGSGSAADVARGGSAQAMSDAFGFESLTVMSSGIVILSEGEPQVRVKEVVLTRGGTVVVTDFELMGRPSTAAGVESLIRFMAVYAALSEANADDRLAISLGAGRVDLTAEVVPNFVRAQLEHGISQALQQALAEQSISGGVDLLQSLGIPPICR